MAALLASMLSDSGANEINAKGGKLALGIAISLPTFDDAQFDIGAVGHICRPLMSMWTKQPTLSPLPGIKGGLAAGLSKGSVSDLRGQGYALKGQTNIGKKASSAIVKGISQKLPKGNLKNFVDGPVNKTAGSLLGFVASGAITMNEQGEISGVEAGLAKGINAGYSADVGFTGVCSIRSGCTEK